MNNSREVNIRAAVIILRQALFDETRALKRTPDQIENSADCDDHRTYIGLLKDALEPLGVLLESRE